MLVDLRKKVAVNGSLPNSGRRIVNDLVDLWLQTADLRPSTLS